VEIGASTFGGTGLCPPCLVRAAYSYHTANAGDNPLRSSPIPSSSHPFPLSPISPLLLFSHPSLPSLFSPPLNRRGCGATWTPLGIWGEDPAAKRFPGHIGASVNVSAACSKSHLQTPRLWSKSNSFQEVLLTTVICKHFRPLCIFSAVDAALAVSREVTFYSWQNVVYCAPATD